MGGFMPPFVTRATRHALGSSLRRARIFPPALPALTRRAPFVTFEHQCTFLYIAANFCTCLISALYTFYINKT